MRMTNVTQRDANGRINRDNARAKGLFAKSSENELLIQFEYQFCSAEGELVVYLSDVPDLSGDTDPAGSDHRIEIARLISPEAGRPGSEGSMEFGVFSQIVSVQHLSFIKGTYVEFELLGPQGTCILINNWDPAVRCVALKSGDVAGNAPLTIDAIDFLAVMSEYGNPISEVKPWEGPVPGAWTAPFLWMGLLRWKMRLLWSGP